eukprot:scaffold13084_cov26-Tisochrysis_lutea.AAC.2
MHGYKQELGDVQGWQGRGSSWMWKGIAIDHVSMWAVCNPAFIGVADAPECDKNMSLQTWGRNKTF